MLRCRTTALGVPIITIALEQSIRYLPFQACLCCATRYNLLSNNAIQSNVAYSSPFEVIKIFRCQPNRSHPNPPHAPLNLRASWMSFCIIVTLFAWIAHKFVSSNRCTRNASAASCSAIIAVLCHRSSCATWPGSKYCAISLTNRAKGSFSSRRSVDCW